jgi:3-methyladenine DNA glycosylase AlkD
MSCTAGQVLSEMRALADPTAAAGMADYGINGAEVLGIRVPVIRQMARQCGRDHELAQELWESGVHEARLLASMVADPRQVTEEQMERWAADFDSWDVCDQCCGNLFDRTPFAYQKAREWSGRQEVFVKRAGFALMAYLALHDKKAPDEAFVAFFPLIKQQAVDERKYVKKAVNWALRQIGKRNRMLNEQALRLAEHLSASEDKTARWVGSDARRELSSENVQHKLN